MYISLLHKLDTAAALQQKLDGLSFNAHESAYLALNAPRLPMRGGVALFRKATGIREGEIIPAGKDAVRSQEQEKKYQSLVTMLYYALHERNFEVVDMASAHLPGFWDAQMEKPQRLNETAMDYVCNHYKDKAQLRPRLLAAIAKEPGLFFNGENNDYSGDAPKRIAGLLRVLGEDMLKLLAKPDVQQQLPYGFMSVSYVGTRGNHWRELVDAYPPNVMGARLVRGEASDFDMRILQASAMLGHGPVLDEFTAAMGDAAVAAQHQGSLQHMIETSHFHGQYAAFKKLTALPHQKLPQEESSLAVARGLAENPQVLLDTLDSLPDAAQQSRVEEDPKPRLGDRKPPGGITPRALTLADELVFRNAEAPIIRQLAEKRPKAFMEMLRIHAAGKNPLWRVLTDSGEKGGVRGLRRVIDAMSPQHLDAALDGMLHDTKRYNNLTPYAETALVLAWPKLSAAQKDRVLATVPQEAADFLRAPHASLERDYALRCMNRRSLSNCCSRMDWELYLGDSRFIDTLPAELLTQSPLNFSPEAYRALLPLMEQAVRIEGTGDAPMMAYKLATLMQSEKKADAYLKKFTGQLNGQAVHDALLYSIPQHGHWDAQTWQQVALRDGEGLSARINGVAYKLKGTALVGMAPLIEQAYFAAHPGKREKQLHSLRNASLAELYEIAREKGYQRGSENPELANLCISLGASEQQFGLTLDVLKDAAKARNMPDITVDGAAIGKKDYRLRTVKADDPLNLWIGKLVTCCNHIGGETHNNAIAQCKSPDVALYVIEKKAGKDWLPVAKVTGWMGKSGDKMVFNSWERLGQIYDKLCEPFLLAAGIEALKQKPELKEVRLGRNRAEAGFSVLPDIEPPREEGLRWYDAGQPIAGFASPPQHEVVTREKLKLAEVKLSQLARADAKKDSPSPATMPFQQQIRYDSGSLRAT